MSLRSYNDQIAYEDWRDDLARACKAAGVAEPADPAQRWFSGQTDISTIVAAQIAFGEKREAA